MPLHIGEDSYDEIRGPFTLTVLKPRQEPDVTFLLLGENHNFDDWEPCDRPKCANVQTDFIKSLDKLAKRYPVHLFLEDFFEDTDHMAGLPEKEFSKYRLESRDLKDTLTLNKQQKMEAWTKLGIDIKSPMVEVSTFYRQCVYSNGVCPYPHIKWQYADARKQNVLTHSSISSMMPIYYEMIAILHQYRVGREMFPAELLHYKDTTWEDDYRGGITVKLLDHLGKQANNYLMDISPLMKKRDHPVPHLFVEMLTILKEIITEPDEAFVEKLFQEKSVLLDQLMSLPPDLRAKFNIPSCIQIQKHYKAKFPDVEEEHEYVADLLTLLIEYYQSEDRRPKIAAEIERMNYAESQHSFISSVFMYYTAIVLDLYFIFRSYNRKKECKLVVGYFGNAHVDAQVHYLVNVVRTHTISFHNEGKGRVHIAPHVYLAYTPEDIGKRPKRGVSAKNAKRVKIGTRRVNA